MERNDMNTVQNLQRRIRYLQRSIVQLAGQPSIQRRNLYDTLYSNLREARKQLRAIQSGNAALDHSPRGTMA